MFPAPQTPNHVRFSVVAVAVVVVNGVPFLPSCPRGLFDHWYCMVVQLSKERLRRVLRSIRTIAFPLAVFRST